MELKHLESQDISMEEVYEMKSLLDLREEEIQDLQSELKSFKYKFNVRESMK